MNESVLTNEGANVKKIGVLLRHAPYGTNLSQEALECVLAASVYGQALTLIFMGDGVFQLVREQNGSAIQQKTIESQLSALEFYDINNIVICQQSLQERRLAQEDLSIDATLVSYEELTQLLHTQDTLLSF